MAILCHKHECCGCTSCASVCPQNCISMAADSEGFFYPSVNASKCINCHLCTKVCPVLAPLHGVKAKGVFAAHCVDNSIVKRSSSGGIFSVLAQDVISRHGVVYGAQYDDEMNVIFSHAYTEKDLSKFRGSKYVQARVKDCYQDVKLKLQQGIDVLFTGTPCQIAGLKSFLRKPYDNLFAAEVVCHGVPNEKVWHMHLQAVKATQLSNGEVNTVLFRYKEDNWRNYKICYVTRDGKSYVTPRGEDAFFRGFVKCLYSRPSCEKCPFKNGASGADLTLGDLWGVEKLLPDGGNPIGESLVIVNTNKGMEWLKGCSGKLLMTNIRLADAMTYNEGLRELALPHRNRDSFFQKIDDVDNVDVLIDEMLKPNFSERLKEDKEKIVDLLGRAKRKIYKIRKRISS